MSERRQVRDSGKEHRMSTASGLTGSREVYQAFIPQLNTSQDVVVLEGCPNILSLGKMCMGKGYSFEWLPFTNPVLRLPGGRTHKLEVEDFVPVLACGSADLGSPSNKSEEVGKEVTLPSSHFLTHTPKNPLCRHCQEAKITAKPARESRRTTVCTDAVQVWRARGC